MPSPAAGSPFDQSRYQVRLDWGRAGLERLAPADVVVVVDVVGPSSAVAARIAAGAEVALAELEAERDGGAIAAAAAASGSLVLLGCLRNAGAVADAVLGEQQRRGARTSIAVIAAGEQRTAAAFDGSEGRPAPVDAVELRFAVEDLLGAGAVVDALSRRGLDHTSPEAAAACEAARGLGGAVRHLLTASGSGQELIAAGRRDEILAAAQLDVDAAVPTLRDGVFTVA
ncbi:2-phosphosulfolactate phosphatase [Microbacterium oleivorans]|uniref:Probable 2-phosphosulfolactate phosphatase n=1 Tax=Microbacterium oleivorans TaxID=273677 RepID=A0A7D5EXL2_9MICO|nr:2-phosphosulfolactate phosphatase [Microbacterium oleivorans]QLD12164.1 2-phosphosulfolactate phosphatase [Microbacterium oleivorans]